MTEPPRSNVLISEKTVFFEKTVEKLRMFMYNILEFFMEMKLA